jgi:hypothetical protein
VALSMDFDYGRSDCFIDNEINACNKTKQYIIVVECDYFVEGNISQILL